MTAIWIFEKGRLEARNKAGELLRWWLADEAIGRPFAGLLNQEHRLSCLLLWPLLNAVTSNPASGSLASLAEALDGGADGLQAHHQR